MVVRIYRTPQGHVIPILKDVNFNTEEIYKQTRGERGWEFLSEKIAYKMKVDKLSFRQIILCEVYCILCILLYILCT